MVRPRRGEEGEEDVCGHLQSSCETLQDGDDGQDDREDADLDRDDKEETELDVGEDGGKGDEDCLIEDQASLAGKERLKPEVGEDHAPENGVNVEGGAEFSPGVLEGIVDEKGDLHDEEHQEGGEQEHASGQDGREGDEGDHSPVFALRNQVLVEDKRVADFSIKDQEDEDEEMDDADAPDETGKGHPSEFWLQRV